MAMTDWLHKYPGVQALLQDESDVLDYAPQGEPGMPATMPFVYGSEQHLRDSMARAMEQVARTSRQVSAALEAAAITGDRSCEAVMVPWQEPPRPEPTGEELRQMLWNVTRHLREQYLRLEDFHVTLPAAQFHRMVETCPGLGEVGRCPQTMAHLWGGWQRPCLILYGLAVLPSAEVDSLTVTRHA